MADWRNTTPAQLLASHLQRPANTARAYRADLESFREFLKARTIEAAVKRLVNLERGAARRVLEDFKNANRAAGLSLATTRRRVSNLLGLLRLAHEFDIIEWAIRMKLPAADPIRDTRGPGRAAVEAMIANSRRRGDAKGTRDTAILCLLFFSALRAGEVLSLDFRHVDLTATEAEVLIAAKGRWDRVRIPVPLVTRDALADWIQERGQEPGPLWLSMSPAIGKRAARLTYPGLYSMVRTLGKSVGVTCRPHGLRHTAASEIDRLSNGNVAWGMALTRHCDPKTFMAYNDFRKRNMRAASELLAAGRHFGHLAPEA